MGEELFFEIGREVLLVVAKIGLPILGATLVVGILVSIFQAVTQVHEMTLTFVPKILVVILVMIVLGPWMVRTILDFVTRLFWNLPSFVR
ncbi:MAG: flagellar biosynthesis protein FliQ [Candidatus Caldatribacteriaceae bacterium]